MILWMVFVFGILYGQVWQSHAWKRNLALQSLADCSWIQRQWKREAAGFQPSVSSQSWRGVGGGIIRSICWGWLGWGRREHWAHPRTPLPELNS